MSAATPVRQAYAEVSMHCLAALFSGRAHRVEGLPEGAMPKHMWIDSNRNTIRIAFEHESFAEVRPGEIMPALTLIAHVMP